MTLSTPIVCVCVSYMWLCWEGFSDGLSRFASSISLKPELPTFLANWEREHRIFSPPATLVRTSGNPIIKQSCPYQQVWGPQTVQTQRLDPGDVDPHLPVDPWTLNTGQDAQVGREPSRIYRERIKVSPCLVKGGWIWKSRLDALIDWWIDRSITWSSAVTAVVVSWHPSDVISDGPGQILHAALLTPSPLPPPVQRHAQSLLLTVTEHRDPAEHKHRYTF